MTTVTEWRAMIVQCSTCGMRADADPAFHEERYGHWPTVRDLTTGESVDYVPDDEQ